MPITTLRPTGHTSAGAGWTGTFPDWINDNSDGTSVQHATEDSPSEFLESFGNLPTWAKTIRSVVVYTRYSRSDSIAAAMTPFVRLGSDTTSGSTQTGTSISTYNFNASRPGGGTWTPADVDALSGGVVATDGVTTEELYVYDIWWDVDWRPDSGGFVMFLTGLVGAAVGLQEIPSLAATIYAQTGHRILPCEYHSLFADVLRGSVAYSIG